MYRLAVILFTYCVLFTNKVYSSGTSVDTGRATDSEGAIDLQQKDEQARGSSREHAHGSGEPDAPIDLQIMDIKEEKKKKLDELSLPISNRRDRREKVGDKTPIAVNVKRNGNQRRAATASRRNTKLSSPQVSHRVGGRSFSPREADNRSAQRHGMSATGSALHRGPYHDGGDSYVAGEEVTEGRRKIRAFLDNLRPLITKLKEFGERTEMSFFGTNSFEYSDVQSKSPHSASTSAHEGVKGGDYEKDRKGKEGGVSDMLEYKVIEVDGMPKYKQ